MKDGENDESVPGDAVQEFAALFARETVKYPLSVIVIMFVVVLLIAPTYPVEVSSSRWSSYGGGSPSVKNFAVQPPLIVLLNRFEWRDSSPFIGMSSSSGVFSRYQAPVYPMLFYLVAMAGVGLYLLRMKKRGRCLRTDGEGAAFSLLFFGFLLLALGIALSIGILLYGIFGTGYIPLKDRTALFGMFLVFAPSLIVMALYLLTRESRLETADATEMDLSWFEQLFPTTFSACIVGFLLLPFIFQASIPFEQPIDVVDRVTIASMNATSSTSIEITFGEPYRENLVYGLDFVLESHYEGAREIYVIRYPNNVKAITFSMICEPDSIYAVYHGQEQNQQLPVMNAGDTLVISNLTPGLTYTFYVRIWDMHVPTSGQRTVTMPAEG